MMSYHTTSKDNIVRHNISCNFAFESNSLSFIFLEIFAKKYLGQPLKFGIRLTFLSNRPILLIFELSLTN